MRTYQHLLNCSTVIFLGDWGDLGLQKVAEGILEDHSHIPSLPSALGGNMSFFMSNREKVYKAMVFVYRDV